MNSSPARLHCLLSGNNKIVAIYRQGPTKWTQLILWNLETDEFTLGQWMKGSVYHQKSSISFDGRYIATAIAKYAAKSEDANKYYSWTSISKPPYFSALLTLLQQGVQTSGGYFINEKHFVYDGEQNHVKVEGIAMNKHFELSYLPYNTKMKIFGEPPLQDKRFSDLNWKTKQEFKGNHAKTIIPQIKEKSIVQDLYLQLERNTNSFKIESKYFIRNTTSKKQIIHAQWMDIDYKKRILLAKKGSIYISNPIKENNINQIQFELLQTFNDSKPTNLKPPVGYYKW